MSTNENQPRIDYQAVVAIYIAEGFECASRMSKERYENTSDEFGGHIGVMTRIAELAHGVADVVCVFGEKFEFAGVWEYDIGHELGVQFFADPRICNQEFRKLAEVLTDAWIEKNAQN
jgi:hypothetical protein